jgi:SpoVK/Ycf46/Vps4 family AAA+-type ATPase
MATADQLKALLRSFVDDDDDRFLSIAMQMAAHAARTGHTKLAQELRDLVDDAKAQRKHPKRQLKTIPVVQPRGELSGLVSVGYPTIRLSQMALDDRVRLKLERVLREQRARDRLRSHALPPQRKLLLIGPPGTGKTLSAAMFAGELGLPLFSIQLHALITKFMGETAAKLGLVFESLRETRAVYFFDEFDALGGDRSLVNDVGEMRRVLNSFLVFLEQDDGDSLIVAATNHPAMLDRALFRRFDTVIEYALPGPMEAIHVMRARLSTLHSDGVDWTSVASAANGLSHAEIAQACDLAAKDTILDEEGTVSTTRLLDALNERRGARDVPP